MREIKFQLIWQGVKYDGIELPELISGQWELEGIDSDGEFCTTTRKDYNFFSEDESDYGIWREFTGLLDKNGVEIYEGDIVEWDDGSEGKWRRRCEIKWEKSKYILVGFYYDANVENSPKKSIQFKFGAFIYEYDGALEIVGNIHQNPELLNN